MAFPPFDMKTLLLPLNMIPKKSDDGRKVCALRHFLLVQREAT
jgi:hypothetical protein